MSGPEREVTDWQIERYLLGELPAAEREAVARALAADEAVARRASQLRASNREILEAHPPRLAAAIIRERLSARVAGSSWRPGRLALATSLALVATGSLLLLRAPSQEPTATRIKGLQPSLLVYRHTVAGDEVLADRTAARPGDLVQVAYQAAGRPFGVIVSLDGRGGVTVHHPEIGKTAARLASGRPVRLASAFRLDDAPRWERFYFVTSARSFTVDEVVEAARRAGPAAPGKLPLPPDLDQTSFTLTKEEPR
jgi:anti-sigma factor RsiW